MTPTTYEKKNKSISSLDLSLPHKISEHSGEVAKYFQELAGF